MKSSEQIQAVAPPATLRAGRPLLPVNPLDWPRYRRLRSGKDVPALTRHVPTVEILAGAALGCSAGLLLNLGRVSLLDLGWRTILGTLFGALIGWLIATFTGATGTLSWRTVFANMIHIVWVLLVGPALVGFVMILAALGDAAYGRERPDC